MSFNYAVIFTVGRNDSRILLLGAAKDETTNRMKNADSRERSRHL